MGENGISKGGSIGNLWVVRLYWFDGDHRRKHLQCSYYYRRFHGNPTLPYSRFHPRKFCGGGHYPSVMIPRTWLPITSVELRAMISPPKAPEIYLMMSKHGTTRGKGETKELLQVEMIGRFFSCCLYKCAYERYVSGRVGEKR